MIESAIGSSVAGGAVSLYRPARDRLLWRMLLLCGGLAVMYVPVFEKAARTVWDTDEQAHGPIILAVVIWLLWRRRDALRAAARASPPSGASGWITLLVGLAVYILGRVLGIALLEVGSMMPVVAGGLAVSFGWAVVRAAAFPIFFFAFCVPLPVALVDSLTQPLKQAVSWTAEQALHALNYPVSRTGVVLMIGQYRLLVADACAGLNSMFTLEALGLLYMNIMGSTSRLRNVLLAVLIIPMSFCANVFRVMVLTLVTYHLGETVGQSVVHGAAGLLLFATALLLMFAMDSALARLLPRASAGAP